MKAKIALWLLKAAVWLYGHPDEAAKVLNVLSAIRKVKNELRGDSK